MSKQLEPASWIADEGIWDKAKKAVKPEDSDYESPWAVVVDVYKKMGGSVKQKQARSSDPNGGILTLPMWLFGGLESNNAAKPVAQEPAQKEEPITNDGDAIAQQTILDNPKMNAASLVNTLKSKGVKLVKEAEGTSSNVAVLRDDKKKESSHVKFVSKFLESEGVKKDVLGQTKFKVCLIQEGMGNLSDRFYYSKDAIKSGVTVFEGKKFYADHPSKLDEQIRPERSVRDIIGHFENVAVEEAEDGRLMLVADAIVLPDSDFNWARALMRESLEYSQKYPSQELVGLSINADGSAKEVAFEEFVQTYTIPESAQKKISEALGESSSVKVVTSFTEAVSVDLVTEAGAGGKVMAFLEQEKGKEMKQDESKKKEAEGHDDEAQDVALIKKMLAEYLGEEDSENEDLQKHAKEAYEAHKEMGKESEEALQCAGEAMKLAKHMAKKKKESESESEAKEGEEKKENESEAKKETESEAKKGEESEADAKDDKADDEDEEKEEKMKQSAVIAQLKGENTRLKEALKKYELVSYLETKLKESKIPVSSTKEFREILGEPKSKGEIDRLLEAFKKGRETSKESLSLVDFTFTEKAKPVTESKGSKLSFEDCLK